MCSFPAVCTLSLYRRVCSRMLFTTSCSVAMMIVSKRASQRDRVSCSVRRHCLMMMPINCVVFLQKATDFFLEPTGTTPPPRPLASASPLGGAGARRSRERTAAAGCSTQVRQSSSDTAVARTATVAGHTSRQVGKDEMVLRAVSAWLGERGSLLEVRGG